MRDVARGPKPKTLARNAKRWASELLQELGQATKEIGGKEEGSGKTILGREILVEQQGK